MGETTGYAPPTEPVRVLHEDAQLLVVEKPAGLLSVPGKGAELADCLLSRLEVAFEGTLLVHRLDRDTSGVMVFARTKAAQRHLGLQFERRHTSKRYIARVHGQPASECGRIDLPLIADWPNRPKQMVDFDRGKPAETHWRVLEREPGATRVELLPVTGRSHQLRVHMAAIGHPILGDPLYAEGTAREAARLMLHAERLLLRHPDGGAPMTFTARCPF
ncbi:RluA family pseudouridine synthase [Tropicimonas isoalkanivorans]|uniref:Pseudouridine synthase n=1 Tax=Tropicimonas isoalkanivorans TaxID=441112 RepID=A0A1I1KSQ6_9RHOB|nr:RluA family pseudouridine synthase [Tropicimonas isoalkanivorans]SFC63836.1 ribosomal large subunit pseudouridine synthase A [Tropicimonas isoalkanivorans]